MKHFIITVVLTLLIVGVWKKDYAIASISKYLGTAPKNHYDSLRLQGNLSMQDEVASGKIAAIEVSDNLFGYAHKGAGMSYHLTNTDEIFWVEVGDASEDGGIEGFIAGYIDNAGIAHHGINISSNLIRALVNDDAGVNVGWMVQDPEGMIVQGKNSGIDHYAFRVYDGIKDFGTGNLKFAVRNDGQVTIPGLGGKGSGIVEVDNSGVLSFKPVPSVAGDGKKINSSAPKSSKASCQTGDMAWDADFIYVCVTANTWKRSALNSW